MDANELENLIVETLKSLQGILEIKNADILNSKTILFGQNGFLDSMALVTLITELEEQIEENYGHSIILADEHAMSQKHSPFRSISTLAAYINSKI